MKTLQKFVLTLAAAATASTCQPQTTPRWQIALTGASNGTQSYTITDKVNGTDRLAITQTTASSSTAIASVQVTAPGTFTCSTGPVVSFNAGSGSDAAGYALMFPEPGTGTYGVNSVILTDTGTNYTGNFAVSFTGTCMVTSPTATAIVAPAGSPNNPTDLSSTGTAAIRLNPTTTSGTGGLIVYGGGPTYYDTAIFSVTPNGSGGAVYTFPTAASSGGYACAQLDSSGRLSNTSTPCASTTGYAPLASPTFTGTVTIPSGAAIAGYTPLAGPTFTGTVTIPSGANIAGYQPVIATGSTALATSSIASATCQTVTNGTTNSSAASGATTAMKILWTPAVSLQTITGFKVSTSGALSIDSYIPSGGGYIAFNVCNWTASPITPGAVTLNWSVLP